MGSSSSILLLLQIGFTEPIFTHNPRLYYYCQVEEIAGSALSTRRIYRLMLAMRILYKPFAIIAGVIGAKLGHNVFQALWSRVDQGEPPKPRTEDASLPKVGGAAALEAATMAGVAAAVDRASARVFHYLTGIWPGEKHREE